MSLRTNLFISLTATALILSSAACGDDDEPMGNTGGMGGTTATGGNGGSGAGQTQTETIYDVASSLDDYSSLIAAVDKAGLAPALQDPNASLTVFAPNNAAFAALLGAIGASSLDDVTAEQLTPILLYHVLGTEVDAAAATDAASAGSKVDGLGGSIQLALNGDSIQLDGSATVEVADVEASNGIIHGIDAVILPSITDVAVSDANFSSLATALTVADGDASDPQLVPTLDDDSGSFTVFAPTDDAFAALVAALAAGPTGITGLGDFQPYQLIPVLKYHVVAGAGVTSGEVTDGAITTLGGDVQADTSSGVMIDGATVTVADIYTSNGVIHVIDSVLVPSITDVVVTAPELSSLAGAVIAADGDANTNPKVASALDAGAATGSYTLFAPSNQAFADLGAAPSGQALTNVLLYHVFNEATPIYASMALDLGSPTPFDTLQGSTITVSADNGNVILDDGGSNTDTTVIGANYFTSNGVIHVVDKVLLP